MKLFDKDHIVYLDNHLLVAYKEADLLTQPDMTGRENLEDLLKEWIRKEYHKAGNVFLTVVHRLDRPVSGLVLCARTSKALSRLNEQMRQQMIQRVYLAEVEGELPYLEGKLDHYLVHEEHKARVVQEGTPGAKHARLSYRIVQREEHSTLVEIELETGRYHQIRAQMSAAGYPIIGDKRYGSQVESKTIHLHSAKLSFEHPVTKELLKFSSAAPF